MKKRELILDFTSLLDVIMIILFLTVLTMNRVSAGNEQEIDGLQETIVNQQEKIDNLTQDVTVLDSYWKATREALTELDATLHETEETLADTKQALSDTTALLTGTTEELSDTKDALTYTENTLSATQTALTAANSELETVKDRLDKTEQELKDMQASYSSSDTALTEAKNTLTKLQTAYDKLEAEKDTLSETYEQLRTEYDILRLSKEFDETSKDSYDTVLSAMTRLQYLCEIRDGSCYVSIFVDGVYKETYEMVRLSDSTLGAEEREAALKTIERTNASALAQLLIRLLKDDTNHAMLVTLQYSSSKMAKNELRILEASISNYCNAFGKYSSMESVLIP